MNRISCHRNEERWPLLYELLWRIGRGEKHLLMLVTDPLMNKLGLMDKEISRDAHKAKAFIRFKKIADGDIARYVAWHKPDHHIIPLIAPFFKRRFSVMPWSILTPDESVTWDCRKLEYGPGVPETSIAGDDVEQLWLKYYAATFNPARIKIKMMKKEMPVRYWPTMPETKLIPALLAAASLRVDSMIDHHEGFAARAEDFLPEIKTYETLKDAVARCRGCPLHCNATQSVFGDGPTNAAIALVGEQPGDEEDQQGRPFIGPAGQELNRIFQTAKMDRSSVYVTNAVKHFKFEFKGKRRIHKTPDAREVNSCKAWLVEEIKLLQPKVIVTLGLTAARSLIHHGFSLKHDSREIHQFNDIPIVSTWHPSAILRIPDVGTQAQIRLHILDALRMANRFATR